MRTISVSYTPGPELLAAMDLFREVTNHLIAYELQHRTRSPYKLRDANYAWFREHVHGRLAVHYLHSAASFANGIVKSWRKVGEARLPHLYKPVLRLDQMLARVKRKDSKGIKLQVTLAPRQYAMLDLRVKHKHWKDWSQFKLSEVTIRTDSVELPFQTQEIHTKAKHSAGIDLNFPVVAIATSDGRIHEIDISQVPRIQRAMKAKRERVQRKLPTNLAKQRKVLRKYREREHNRVENVLQHKSKEILGLVGDRNLVLENLRTTTKECLKDAKGRKFRAKLSSWPHGRLQEILAQNARGKTVEVYARGTSSTCPFCGGPVTHPTWRESLCPTHGLFDRDMLASVSILARGQVALRGQPFAPSVVASLQEQSALGDDGARTPRTRPDNRCEAVIGDAPNIPVDPGGVYHCLP